MEPAAMWDAVTGGLRETPDGTTIALIVDAVRDQGLQHAEETVRVVDRADAPIVGLGLTGIEGSAPEREFKLLRDEADRMGLGLAVHAGETGTAENVRGAIEDLAPTGSGTGSPHGRTRLSSNVSSHSAHRSRSARRRTSRSRSSRPWLSTRSLTCGAPG